MNIDKALDRIVFKYDIDCFYPNYRKMRQAEELIEKFVSEWRDDEHIACIIAVLPLGDGFQEGRRRFKKFTEKRKKVHIDYFVCIKNTNPKGYNDIYQCDELYGISEKQYDKIIYISYCGEEYIARWLAIHKPLIRYISLYDYFAMHGLVLQHEYYDYIFKDIDRLPISNGFGSDLNDYDQCVFEIIKQKQKEKIAATISMRLVLKKKIFFLSLVIRDFVLAKQYVEKIIEDEPRDATYHVAWGEINQLLYDMENRLKNRAKKDILLFWIDGVSYEQSMDMGFLWEQITAGTCFDNMVSPVPYTRPTLTNMLYTSIENEGEKARVVNDVEDGDVFKLVKENGYKFRVICSNAWKGIEKKYGGVRYYRLVSPSSLRIWEAFTEILSDDSPMFIMTHCFSETHGPYLSTNIESNDVRFFLSENDTNQNRIVGKMKLDEQLKYYSRMVGKNTTVILMSDHGHEAIWNRSHVFFAVCGKDYAQQHISKMTSLLEFPMIMRAIFSGKKIANNLPELEHVNIEQLDLYSKKTISMYFNRKGFIPWYAIFSFGYRGVLTEDYEYIRYNLGFEILIRRGSMKYSVPPYVIDTSKCEHALVEKFRELDEQYEATSVSSQKMRYARFFRAVIERALPRNIKKVKKLNNILSPYMANSVAIRSGGADAGDIYSGLTHENQKKIVCVIDKNPQCICHTALGLPVVSPEEVDMSKFSAIILGSRKLRTIIHEECLQYPKKVNLLDIEMILAEQGYHCGPGFWDIETLPEDWDVGFPFD